MSITILLCNSLIYSLLFELSLLPVLNLNSELPWSLTFLKNFTFFVIIWFQISIIIRRWSSIFSESANTFQTSFVKFSEFFQYLILFSYCLLKIFTCNIIFDMAKLLSEIINKRSNSSHLVRYIDPTDVTFHNFGLNSAINIHHDLIIIEVFI